ncbi:MAG TPA: AMP-binding protein [Candidatus Dormibacteraeota bacterium]|jgi:acyl-CoA synthetase (AMP-forming)/AMP-acid ligase II|nr:AMP-binding protein [Candidatus Dormibacteraeota bacterium]
MSYCTAQLRSNNQMARLLVGRAGSQTSRPAYAVAEDDRIIRYGDIFSAAQRWEESLAAHRVAPGHRVALLADDPLTFIASYISLLSAGVTVLPLNPQAAPAQLESHIEMLGADLLATERPGSLDVRIPEWVAATEGAVPAQAPIASPRVAGAGSSPAVLLTSSGTTGAPKVVPLDLGQMFHVAGQVVRHHRLSARDRAYSPLPLFHVNAQVMGVIGTMVAGSTLVVDRRFHRTAFWQRMDDWRITWCNTVPAIVAILAREDAPPEHVSARLRFARSASAPLPVPVLRRFEERTGISVLETYGMSEAAGQITANPLDPTLRRPGSVGLPVGTHLRVVDADGQLCQAGEVGSVEISGPAVIDRYLVPGTVEGSRPACTDGEWLVTGDVGYRDDAGFVFLTARADDVINRSGEKVYPREVEEVLLAHTGVTDAAVVGQDDPVFGQCPVAYVVAGPGVEPALLAEQLQEYCLARLERSKRPARLLVVDDLPKGPTGKVSKRILMTEGPGAVRTLAGARAS